MAYGRAQQRHLLADCGPALAAHGFGQGHVVGAGAGGGQHGASGCRGFDGGSGGAPLECGGVEAGPAVVNRHFHLPSAAGALRCKARLGRGEESDVERLVECHFAAALGADAYQADGFGVVLRPDGAAVVVDVDRDVVDVVALFERQVAVQFVALRRAVVAQREHLGAVDLASHRYVERNDIAHRGVGIHKFCVGYRLRERRHCRYGAQGDGNCRFVFHCVGFDFFRC